MYFIYMDKKIFILLVLIIIIIYNLNYYKYNLNEINNYELFTLRENLTNFRKNILSGLSYEIKGNPSLIFTRNALKSRLSINDTVNHYSMSKTIDHYIYIYERSINEKENKIIIDNNNKTYKLLKTEYIEVPFVELTIYSFYNDTIKDALKIFDDFISKIYPNKDIFKLPKYFITFRNYIAKGQCHKVFGDPYLWYDGDKLSTYIQLDHIKSNYNIYKQLDVKVFDYISDPENDAAVDQQNIKKYIKTYKYFTVNKTAKKIPKYIYYDKDKILTLFDNYMNRYMKSK